MQFSSLTHSLFCSDQSPSLSSDPVRVDKVPSSVESGRVSGRTSAGSATDSDIEKATDTSHEDENITPLTDHSRTETFNQTATEASEDEQKVPSINEIKVLSTHLAVEERQFCTTKMDKGSPLDRHQSLCISIPLEKPTIGDLPEAEDLETAMNDMAQPISGVMNFPACEKSHHPDFRCCVMCGKVCATKRYNSRNSPIVPPQNKGVCTACDVTIWVVVKTGLKIKWCKGCKNFQRWALFGAKPHATKCVRCRHQQRERYARKKEREAALLLASTSSQQTTSMKNYI